MDESELSRHDDNNAGRGGELSLIISGTEEGGKPYTLTHTLTHTHTRRQLQTFPLSLSLSGSASSIKFIFL